MKTKMDMLIETYAEVNYLTTEQVKKEIKSGWIDGNMLFEEWLKYEGIFGYSEKIINIFDTCEKSGIEDYKQQVIKIPGDPHGKPGFFYVRRF